MSVVTVGQAKLHMGIPPANTSQDAAIQQWLDGAEEAIWQWLGRYRAPGHTPFESVETTEYYDGGDREKLVLKRRPVTAVAGVWVDRVGYYGQNPTGFPDPDTFWTLGQDYAPMSLDATENNPSILVAFAGAIPTWQGQPQKFPAWPRGSGNIKVTYTAGYASLPYDLVSAICNVVAYTRAAAPRGMALESEMIGRYSYTVLKSGGKTGGTLDIDEIGQALSTLARYKEVNI